MNEFVAKKLGEVWAFTTVGSDTIAHGRTALVEALGAEKILDMEEKNRLHAEAIEQEILKTGVSEITIAKRQKTEEKLKQMRDLYIGDQWQNATELMEWSGFFEGAAIVHWNLVRGAAQGMDDENLILLSEEAINWHYELLELAEGELETTGQDKTTT